MKKTIKTLAIFSLIMSGIYFGKWFIQTDYFKIREIPVSGDNALLKRSIVSKLEKLKGENIVYIDTKKIEKMVKEDARVKNATIQKVFPSKLKVNIEERKLHAYVKKGTDLFLADSELNLFGYIQEEKFKNIPKILETPYVGEDKKNQKAPYLYEIQMIRQNQFDPELLSKIISQ